MARTILILERFFLPRFDISLQFCRSFEAWALLKPVAVTASAASPFFASRKDVMKLVIKAGSEITHIWHDRSGAGQRQREIEKAHKSI